MNNARQNVRNEFKKELKKYEKEYGIKIGSDTMTKLADNYAMTLLLEKDIEPIDWIEENIDDILITYAEDITLLKNKEE